MLFRPSTPARSRPWGPGSCAMLCQTCCALQVSRGSAAANCDPRYRPTSCPHNCSSMAPCPSAASAATCPAKKGLKGGNCVPVSQKEAAAVMVPVSFLRGQGGSLMPASDQTAFACCPCSAWTRTAWTVRPTTSSAGCARQSCGTLPTPSRITSTQPQGGARGCDARRLAGHADGRDAALVLNRQLTPDWGPAYFSCTRRPCCLRSSWDTGRSS